MSSFHRPKIYRSNDGCCICGAKSSSSRFTDSRRYEIDFEKCFGKAGEGRSGEICNACVLVVKRSKKLPPDSEKNWGYVLDARTGPGLKSISKMKTRRKMARPAANRSSQGVITKVKETHGSKMKYLLERLYNKKRLRQERLRREKNWLLVNSGELSDDVHRDGSLDNTDQSDTESESRGCDRGCRRRADFDHPFINDSYWRRETVCCGVVFRGRYGELLIDEGLWQPCNTHSQKSANESCDMKLTVVGAATGDSPMVSVATADSWESSPASTSPACSPPGSSSCSPRISAVNLEMSGDGADDRCTFVSYPSASSVVDLSLGNGGSPIESRRQLIQIPV